MTSSSASVLQFSLPFEGLLDRVRTAVESGHVLVMKSARRTMHKLDISDVLIIRAVRNGRLLGNIQQGNARGEWRCFLTFRVKGFRSGGIIEATFSEGRVFVEDIQWDQSHEQ